MVKRKKRCLIAFFLCFVYVVSLLDFIPVAYANSLQDFYNDLVKIHGNNPKWTYNEFVERINQISQITLSPERNVSGYYINPYAYEHYNQLVVYGLPHGATSDGTTGTDFYVTSKGRMFNLKNGKQGEYRYLGYNYNGISVTNDSWFNPEYKGGGRFASADDYRNLKYDVISGARALWDSLDNNVKNYLLTTKFRDDDYVGGNSEPTPYSLTSIWSDLNFIYNHILIQIEPGISRSASLKLSYGGKYHNTLTIDPIPFSFTGNICTDKDVYTLAAGQNEVTVDISMSAKFSNSTANSFLKSVEFSCLGSSKTLTAIPNQTDYTVEGIKKQTYSRSNLNAGKNEILIEGYIQVNSKYKDYQSIKVSKKIIINVEENPEPWVTAVMTAKPNIAEFDDNDIPVTLEIAYGIANFKDLNMINDIYLLVEGEGTFIKPPALIGEHKMNVKIPKTFMSGYDRRDKIYTVHVQYNLKNGASYKASTSASVAVFRKSAAPSPTPTPAPEITNNPPYVILDYPRTVKAGDVFKITAKANDDDGDPLSYYWDLGMATLSINSTSYKYIWYDYVFSNTVQDIYCEVSDGEDIGADLASIFVLPPTVEAKMKITGTYKVNRAIHLFDISESPEKYTIISRQWVIEPVSGGTADDIKIKGNLTDSNISLLFKKEGTYKITLSVVNSAGFSDTLTKTLVIQPDLKPVANVDGVTVLYRETEHGGNAVINLTDLSYSPDNDIISKRIWSYKFDSDNDGSFDDEEFIVLNSSNLDKYSFTANSVGKYLFKVEVIESFGQETISEFISDTDYMRAEDTIIIEVSNIAPIVSFFIKEKPTVDIVLDVGKTNLSLNEIESKVNQYIKPAIIENGFNPNIIIKNMNKSDRFNNVFAFTDKLGSSRDLMLYNPDTGNTSLLKRFTDNDWYYVKKIFLGPDGHVYYIKEISGYTYIYKIDAITAEETIVISFYLAPNYSLGLDGYLYVFNNSRVYKVDLSNYKINSYAMPSSVSIGGLFVDKDGIFHIIQRSGRYIYYKTYNPFTGNSSTVATFDDRYNEIFFIGRATDNSGMYLYILEEEDYIDRRYYYRLPYDDVSFINLGTIAGMWIDSIRVAPNGKFYLYVANARNDSGHSYYQYYGYNPAVGSIQYLGTSDRYHSRMYIGFGADNTEYFWDEINDRIFTNNKTIATVNGDVGYVETFSSQFKIPSISASYNDNYWNMDSLRFYISYHNDYYGQMLSETQFSSVGNAMKNDNVVFIGLGNDLNKFQHDNILKYVQGTHIDSSNIDNAFIQLRDYILENLEHDADIIVTKYIEVNKGFDFVTHYGDYENDPQYSIRYLYTHDPTVFENNLGYADNMGVYLEQPMLSFSKPGLYEISVQVSDNPKSDNRFSNYRKWSLPKSMKIYVHRPPVADFSYVIVNQNGSYYLYLTDLSYDLDHMSLSNRGIVQSRWFYKANNENTWKSGYPTTITPNEKYYIKLEVMDMEYSWSSVVKEVTYSSSNRKPVALFYFNENPVSKNDYTYLMDVITDISFDPDGDEIVERKWTVTKNGTLLPNGINTVLNNTGEGEYTVTLEVKDSKNAWSDPYTLILTVVGDNKPPTVSISPPNRLWDKTNATVNVLAVDTGGSGLKEIRYLWTTNPEFPDSQFTVVNTSAATLSVSQTDEGSWYLYAQAIDNAGNASSIVKGGPYQIDKTAPELTDFIITGEDFRDDNVFWIGRNKTVDVNIKSKELLSGMKYTYLRVLQGDNRALHDWIGSSNNVSELITSSYTDIVSAERLLVDSEKGEYEVRFTLEGLSDVISMLQYDFTDIAGNTSGFNDSGFYIGVDTIAPVISATPETRDIEKTPVTVSVQVTDSGSGVKDTKYIVSTSNSKPAPGSGWTTEYSENFNIDITGTGIWYVYIESRDNVGNISELKLGPYKVDVTGPVISAVPVNRPWDNEDVNITITVTEGDSDLQEVRYSVTKTIDRVYSGWQHTTADEESFVTIKDDGEWYLHVEAEDILGNMTYTYFGPYQVDREKPVLSAGYVGGARYVSGNNYYARQGDTVIFWLQGEDALSGVWRIFAMARDGVTDPYREANKNGSSAVYGSHTKVRINSPEFLINTGKILKANFPFEILTGETLVYNIEGIADDNASFNREGWLDTGIRLVVDNTAPTILFDEPSGVLMGNDVELGISAIDNINGSGVASISYAISRNSAIPSSGWTTVDSDMAFVPFPEEGYWYVHVRSSDRVGNTSYAVELYEIIFNTPPVINILGTEPPVVYEGDFVSAVIEVDDLQLQELIIEVILRDSNNNIVWSGTKIVNPVGGSYPVVLVPMIDDIVPGTYTIFAKATDTYGDTDTDEYSFVAAELSITGFVGHTDIWEHNRQDFNMKKSGSTNLPRSPETFWSGERFILNAETTQIDPQSEVYAVKVYTDILGYGYHAELSSQNGYIWKGELWDASMINKWGNTSPEILTFRFTVEYSNGTVKTDDVQVIIDNREQYYKLHQIW